MFKFIKIPILIKKFNIFNLSSNPNLNKNINTSFNNFVKFSFCKGAGFDNKDKNYIYKKKKFDNFDNQKPINNFDEKEMVKILAPHIEKIESLLQSENINSKKDYIFDLFYLKSFVVINNQHINNKKDYKTINELFKNDKTDRLLKDLIKQVLPELNLFEKKRIGEVFLSNNKLPEYILTDFLNDIKKFSQKENFDLTESKHLLSLLHLVYNIDEVRLRERQSQLGSILISFADNFDKLKQIFTLDSKLFLRIFNKFFLIEKKSEKIQHLHFESSTHLYDILSHYLLDNFDNVNLIELSYYLDICDKNFYKNEALYKKIIDNVESICENMDEETKYLFLSNITFPLINSNAVIKNDKGKVLLNYLLDFYYDQLVNAINMNKLTFQVKQLVFIHSVVFNDIPDDERLRLKANKMLKSYIDFLYQILISKDKKFDKNFTFKFLTSLYHPLVYSKSVKVNKIKVDELLNLLLKDPQMIEVLNRSIISYFHRDFLKYLLAFNIQYKVEDRQDYLSKDIALEGFKDKICFEMDGAKHFYRDGDLKYSTKLRAIILKNFGWIVVNVNYFEWKELKEPEKKEFVRNILNKFI